jgi:hypothetical protein
MAALWLMVAFAAVSYSVSAQVECRNSAGKPVDWWIALKVMFHLPIVSMGTDARPILDHMM